ncbi:MAG: efflux RND transporter permease subunit [Methylacidiphilales bacterium]|nr:efflux RND transporter permease subunit [Candidatus Methylacidiphilales bacterium]
MPRFAILYPYFIVVLCLMICVVGVSSIMRMPVDLFPAIRIPVVQVATFYNGMPPEQIENDITGRFERFFTLGSGIEHIESRSMTGVSLIKVYFQPGTSADSAVTTISNLAMADLGRLPPGTLPPVVLKSDASSLPVCLVTLKGSGLNETQLRDLGQFAVRNQIASVPGASVPQPFGGRYRQIMVYVDPDKLEANQLSIMDVVRTVNESNLILPAGNVSIGPTDYNIYTNSQLTDVEAINNLPLKMVGQSPVLVRDVGYAKDASQIQYNIVRIDGQKSVYLPILKQGGDSNTISIVDGVKKVTSDLLDVPKTLITSVVFDQSVFVKTAIENLLHEGAIGLVLTGVMILVFLGNVRATIAVFLSIPLSALATFIFLYFGGSSINSMILGGLALAFSRLIDNSVVVLENIFRHMELGVSPAVAAESGGNEVALPVLAATLTTAIVFFPVIFLYGVSQFLFTALALAVVISLFASYVVAMTVVPLFCAKLISADSLHGKHGPNQGGDLQMTEPIVSPELQADVRQNGSHFEEKKASSKDRTQKAEQLGWGARFNLWFNARFANFLDGYEWLLGIALIRPFLTIVLILGLFAASFLLWPSLGLAYFPRTDPAQFVINLKAATGTRIQNTEALVSRVETLIRREVAPEDLRIIASNIGINPDISAIFNPNSGTHTAIIQVGLRDDHKIGSYAYMDKVRAAIGREIPEVSTYFQSGGLVDAVLNLGLPAPIDVKVSGSSIDSSYAVAQSIADQVRKLPGVSDVLIPQDIDAPAIKLDIDRIRASELNLSQKEVVDNVISALTSNGMIAPSYWIDPKTGNDYLLTVQYPEGTVKTLTDLRSIPLHGVGETDPTRLDMVSNISRIVAPTEVDHYQLRRTTDVYVATKSEALGGVASAVQKIIDATQKPEGVRVSMKGSVQAMNASFSSFGTGLVLAVVLVYLVLVAQFRSFIDPFLILLAVPPGIMGVLVMLVATGTTLNVMSLMGVIMMVGIVVSNSILIVEFTHRMIDEEAMPVREAVAYACRIRLRPILMTSLATIFGMIPMAMKLGTGAEAYAPLARAIIGGLTASVILTVFLVPPAFLMVYRGRKNARQARVSRPQLEASTT